MDATFALKAGTTTYGPYDIGLRLKGNASFRTLDGKAAFKLKFNHSVSGQKFLGLKKLTLNNMVQDPSMLHETHAYEVFRYAGVPAPRTGFAFVRVDGEPYGVYLNIETVDSVFLERWFASTTHLYEGEYGADVEIGRASGLQVEEGSETDHSDLNALMTAAAEQGPGWADRVAPHADLEEMTRMWAVEKLIGHWDSYSGGWQTGPNNYFLHSDAGGRFSMVRVTFLPAHGGAQVARRRLS